MNTSFVKNAHRHPKKGMYAKSWQKADFSGSAGRGSLWVLKRTEQETIPGQLLTYGSEADARKDISVKRAPDVFQTASLDGYTAHCDPWGRGRAAAGVIVLAKHADMAIEAALAAVAGRNDIAGAKVGQ